MADVRIFTEITPNPSTLKFVFDRELGISRPVSIPDAEAAEVRSPLAAELFRLSGVISVFLGPDFVSVTKSADTPWNELTDVLIESLQTFFGSGQSVLNETQESEKSATNSGGSGDLAEIDIKIQAILEEQIAPALAMDGGAVVFHGFDAGIVKLELQGACAGCPSSTQTLKMGIENLLKEEIPEVETIEQVF